MMNETEKLEKKLWYTCIFTNMFYLIPTSFDSRWLDLISSYEMYN